MFLENQVKKNGTKAFANLIISLVLIAFEIWAWIESNNIKVPKNCAVPPYMFPRIMIIGMAIFTVVLLIQSIIKLATMKADDPLAAKAEPINPVKDKGVLAALFVIALCVVYVLLFKNLGYVIDSFIICAVIMWLISVRKPAPLLLISFLVPLGMWLLFYKLLKVNIPMGVLQFLRDLVDKI